MDTTNGLNVFALAGELVSKDSHTTSFRQQYPQLFSLLDSVPLFAFSPTGINNICARFRISRQILEGALLTYTRPGELTAEEERTASLAPFFGEPHAPAPKYKVAVSKRKKGGVQC